MKNDNVVEATKRTPVIVWKKSVNGLNEFMQFMSAIRKIKEINDFLNNHTLYNVEIAHNACYDLAIGNNVIYVYLNMDVVSIVNNNAVA